MDDTRKRDGRHQEEGTQEARVSGAGKLEQSEDGAERPQERKGSSSRRGKALGKPREKRTTRLAAKTSSLICQPGGHW